jgi:hypothetical protein
LQNFTASSDRRDAWYFQAWDALQPVSKRYEYLQRLLVAREYPREDPRWQDNAQW